jgi:hypothetical protein
MWTDVYCNKHKNYVNNFNYVYLYKIVQLATALMVILESKRLYSRSEVR